MERWSEERAWTWYNSLPPIRGVNYVPSYASNMLEWWQEATWRGGCIDRELAIAAACGFTSVRCNLHVLVWEREQAELHHKIEYLLDRARAYNMRVVFCLFDDCNFGKATTARLGTQEPPVPGVHNSRWIASPLPSQVTDMEYRPILEAYTRDLVRTYRTNQQILFWDLYNEPGNMGMDSLSLPLVKEAFRWAREEHPSQPCTSGAWRKDPIAEHLLDLSDVITFHCYETADVIEKTIKELKTIGRPVICTETIRRQPGKSFRDVLPVFMAHNVGWYSWGLVAGKQQTYLPWEIQGRTINDPWHWDLLYPDGTPYDPEEIKLIQSFGF